MRPRLKTIGAAAVVLILAAADPAPSQDSSQANTGPAMTSAGQYTDPTFGFSMAVPTLSGKAKERTSVVFFQGPQENGFASNVNVLVDPGKTTKREYMAAWHAILKQTNPGARFHDERELQVSGRDAQLVDFEASMGGKRLRFLQLLVIDDDAAYVLTCTSPLESFAAHEAEFRRCIASFSLPSH